MTNYNKINKVQKTDETETFEESKLNEPVYGTIVKCGRLNLREQPSKESAVLRVLDANATVQILNDIDGWYNVCTVDGVEGFLVRDFVKLS